MEEIAEVKTYHYDSSSLDCDTPGIREAMLSITYKQAQEYEPNKYGIAVEQEYIPGAYVFDIASKKALAVLAFLCAWTFYNGSCYDAYYDTRTREVILGIKNKEYHVVWED